MVADLIKGLPINEAEAQLLAIRKRAAQPLLKLLRSAVANLKNNKRLSEEKFYIESVRVDQGPMLKRSLPRARGMATPIQKKMSNITLILGENIKLTLPRFKIVVKKKTKLPDGVTGPTKKEKPKREEKIIEAKKPGFFKKLFNPKSRASK